MSFPSKERGKSYARWGTVRAKALRHMGNARGQYDWIVGYQEEK